MILVPLIIPHHYKLLTELVSYMLPISSYLLIGEVKLFTCVHCAAVSLHSAISLIVRIFEYSWLKIQYSYISVSSLGK